LDCINRCYLGIFRLSDLASILWQLAGRPSRITDTTPITARSDGVGDDNTDHDDNARAVAKRGSEHVTHARHLPYRWADEGTKPNIVRNRVRVGLAVQEQT